VELGYPVGDDLVSGPYIQMSPFGGMFFSKDVVLWHELFHIILWQELEGRIPPPGLQH
jgi:hypothetical protein